MIINNVDYNDKDKDKWERLSDNLETAIDEGWIPVPMNLEVKPELIEAGYPNFEGKEVKYVECPACMKQLQIGFIYNINRHKSMGCEGGEE